MKQAIETLRVVTAGQGFYDLTQRIGTWLAGQHADQGLLTIWCRHTSASLIMQENADRDVRADLLDFFRRIAPERDTYRHTAEGPDDMPAHIKAALTQPGLCIPVEHGAPTLGTWQAIYLFEHRTRSHERLVVLHFIGS